MIRDILSISLLLLLLSCVSLGLDVRQSPSELIKPPGDKVQISCSHDRTDYRECSNQKDRKWRKTLVCVASGFYPDHVSVSWQVDPPAVSSSGVATDSSALRGDKTYRISSRLRVSASDWFTEGRKFTCRKYLKTTQAAKLSYVVFIVKSSVYGAGVAFLLWRLQVGVSLGLDVRQSPSELIKPPGDKVQISCSHDRTDYRECSNQKDRKWRKTLVCVASGFYPDHVSVSWQVDPPAVSSSGVATDSSALRGDKTYRISSRLRVSASDWFTEGRKFTCRKYLKTTQAAKLSYVVFIVKSSVYGAGVAFLLWRLQGSAGKQNN
ncbi:hypothetical protein F7725_008525 [Dissostichus mawsoni]|uniref:Ig-like domain-containing protein n=1 Tax=Dissostichus mawsoni TaxID=36200 RepID=A0A7J5Y7F3_DISMA|nr:hypothetical protein F7725_008525 [Dissostichus mawsoni]